ncbi:HI_0552 family protein [Peribacillus sp. S4]|uniref:HI_0552 family protein n=1 Tax=Peribacillus sp. S4 TaxID=3384451 RepID=UPI003989F45A
MNINNSIFEVFDREDFIYRVKEESSTKVKREYTSAWNEWKAIVGNSVSDSGCPDLVVENTEKWQNSGNLSKRFWSRIKDEQLLEHPSCIAAMISKTNLRVYLEWHAYKNGNLVELRKQHNDWILSVEEWIKEKGINPSEYRVWTNKETDEGYLEYKTLEEFINNKIIKESLLEALASGQDWIRVGKVFDKADVLKCADFSKKMGNTIKELEWIYKKVTGKSEERDKRYWLFNVSYISHSEVWKESKKLNVAAMQYEKGKEDLSSITRNLNVINQISIGDYIIAYTGAKGFLGFGKVNKKFYEEEEAKKFINVGGGNWRQRVGVDWIEALDSPIQYEGRDFKRNLDIKGSNQVMGSSTIFEISNTGFNYVKELIESGTKDEVKESFYTFLSNKELINHIHSYITAKGFSYTLEEVMNLFLSLKTKPFVILSGISGTGKTKIVQWFAESVGATEDNGQFTLIPIRPDWNDGSDLLGYVDIKGDFKPGPFTTVIEKAEQNPDDPYFVLLDEMNLARVEHYFSDVLSVMESRKWEDGKMVTSALLSAEMAKRDIRLPVNLYVIGTVNMDETTHPFSKKVLDRANTIEFNRVELSNLAFLEEQVEVEPKLVQDHMFRSKYLHLKDLYLGNQELVKKVTAELEDINKSLLLTNAHIGYRVRDEICFYLAYNEDSELMSFENAFDHCILQKILPRISGSDTRVQRLLEGLYRLFTTKEYIDDEESNEISIRTARYPKSTGKVVEMLRRLQDGFTSFWIS